jgi:hypothetical protein
MVSTRPCSSGLMKIRSASTQPWNSFSLSLLQADSSNATPISGANIVLGAIRQNIMALSFRRK